MAVDAEPQEFFSRPGRRLFRLGRYGRAGRSISAPRSCFHAVEFPPPGNNNDYMKPFLRMVRRNVSAKRHRPAEPGARSEWQTDKTANDQIEAAWSMWGLRERPFAVGIPGSRTAWS